MRGRETGRPTMRVSLLAMNGGSSGSGAAATDGSSGGTEPRLSIRLEEGAGRAVEWAAAT